MNKTTYLVLAVILFMSSCSTKVDVIGEWKDITVVYGLLNQVDSITYVKINKAFLGEGNALVMAQVADSSSYDNALEVTMQELKDGVIQKSFTFDTTTIYNKDSGTFYFPNQVLYSCVTNHQLDPSAVYKLIIHNKLTGKDVTGQTPLVGDFSIVKPLYNNPDKPTISFPDNQSLKEISWISAPYGKRYQVVMRFNYKEKFFDQPDTLYKYKDYFFSDQKSLTLVGGENMQLEFVNGNFYTFLGNSIPYEPSVEAQVDSRVAGTVDLIFSVAGDDFNTYLEVNAPSTTIIQDRPEYTNMTDGIGIFSCRYNKERKYFLTPTTVGVLVTKNLKFVKVIGS
jgi:hypothetical protein